MSNHLGKVTSFFKAISVEPIIFIYYFNVFIYSMGTDNLFLQKNCMPEGLPDTNAVCHDEKSLTIAADISTLRSALRDCSPGITVLVAGVWRDHFGVSKPLIIYALCGEILSNIVVIIGYFYWSSSSWIISSVEGVIIIFTGGAQLVLMSANCHVIEKTDTKNRTARISYVIATMEISAFLGYATSGPILSVLGYKYYLFAIVGLHLLNILLTVVLIKETPKSIKERKNIPRLPSLGSVFKCEGNRAGIWMMIAASGSINVILNGESNVMLYYLERGFKYSVTEAGYYSAYRIAAPTILSLIVSSIMMNIFKLGDCKILMFSATLTMISATSLAFANTLMELIILILLDMKPMIMSVIKSILSKFLKPEETGMFFGFESIVSSYLPLGFLAVYDKVFGATISSFPGAFYSISSALELIILFLTCMTFCMYGEPGTELKEESIEAKPESEFGVEESPSHQEQFQTTVL